MAKATRVCSICGKEYPYCKTFRKEGVFRWQEVACCQEHGSQYFAEVLAARAASRARKEPEQTTENAGKERDPHDEPLNKDDAIFEDVNGNNGGTADDYWYEEAFNG